MMDLYAYAKIPNLEVLLKENKIDIQRLRGLRLMKEEKPIADEDLKKLIEEEKLMI